MARLRLLVGLGNPGPRYRRTRHNLGFDWIERLAERWKAELKPWKGLGEAAEAERPGGRVWLARPLTFMNVSGSFVGPFAKAKGAAPGEVLVGYDELSLPLGRLRLRLGGSAGGHNGMRSVLEALGTPEVPRLRMGIARGAEGEDPVDHVLSRFRPEEQESREAMLEQACEAAERAVDEGLEAAMNRYNPAG